MPQSAIGATSATATHVNRIWDRSNVSCKNPKMRFWMGRMVQERNNNVVECPLTIARQPARSSSIRWRPASWIATLKNQSGLTESKGSGTFMGDEANFISWGGAISSDARS